MIHYHFFKNAGTSVDRTLRENFGITWTAAESEDGGPMFAPRVEQFLRENPWVVALSSHTAQLPLPRIRNAIVLPVIFLRHPIDRALSVYEFELEQVSDTEGAVMAKETDFAGYVAWRLSREYDRMVCNFQTQRLDMASSSGSWRDRALSTLHSLPFVGLVEEFDQSLDRLQQLLSGHFPQVRLTSYWENGQSTKPALAERLEAIRDSLGEPLFGRLVEANATDLELWTKVKDRYQ